MSNKIITQTLTKNYTMSVEDLLKSLRGIGIKATTSIADASICIQSAGINGVGLNGVRSQLRLLY